MPLFRRVITGLRLTLRGSNSAKAWQERVADLVLLAGLVTALAVSVLVSMEWWQVPITWVLCLLPAAALSWRGWLKVFGPVLYYDMMRQGRNARFIVYRFLYAVVLACLLYMVWASIPRFGTETNVHQAADIAQKYFSVFTVVQFTVLVLLTPVYVAGAITEEKQRKTLEFMLATDLLNREIVLSKLASRLGNLALVVLTGLPIVGILQFLGGVDPNVVLAAFAATSMTVLSVAGMSILCSVACKTSARAIVLAYLLVMGYYASTLVIPAVMSPAILRTPIWFGRNPPTVEDLFKIYNTGNLSAFLDAVRAAGSAGTLAALLPVLVRDYAMVHGSIALACTALAIARLRKVALTESSVKAKTARTDMLIWSRPAIGSRPLLWKELHCGNSRLPAWAAAIWMATKLVATFVPALLIPACCWAYFHYGRFGPGYDTFDRLAFWISLGNLAIGCLTILAIAIRASISISGERDKQTLDTLLTTPVPSWGILQAKWAGSMLSARLGFIWLAVIWIAGIATGVMSLVSLVLTICAWTIYASFASALGLWFSTVGRSSLQSMVATILVLVGLSVSPFVAWWCFGSVATDRTSVDGFSLLARTHVRRLAPPFMLYWLPHYSHQHIDPYEGELSYSTYGVRPYSPDWNNVQILDFLDSPERALLKICFSVIALGVWLLAAIALSHFTGLCFRQMTNRVPRAQISLEDWLASKQGRRQQIKERAGAVKRPDGRSAE